MNEKERIGMTKFLLAIYSGDVKSSSKIVKAYEADDLQTLSKYLFDVADYCNRKIEKIRGVAK